MTAFDKPQWPIRSGPKRNYLCISSGVRISPVRGRVRTAHVVIPASLFLFMQQVLWADLDSYSKGGYLYLDETDDRKHWILGLASTDGAKWIDLWGYPANKVPAALRNYT